MQRGDHLTSYQSILDALDRDPALANLPSAAHLNIADMYTETRHQELQKYPHTDRMVEALKQAGLIEKNNQQVFIDLLFACKTIKLRGEHKGSHNNLPVDEHAELADFMERMAARKLLSVKLCLVVFGDITWQQKLHRLQEILEMMEPLTQLAIDTLAANIFSYFDLQEKMQAADETNECFRFLFNSVKVSDHDAIQNCIRSHDARNYHQWLNKYFLMQGLQRPLMIHDLFRGWHLLNKAGMLSSHHQVIIGNINNSHYLDLLDDAKLLDPEYAKLVIDNEVFAAAIHLLKDAELLGPTHNIFHSRKSREVNCFNAEDSRFIMAALLCQTEHCSKLVQYSITLSKILDQGCESYFETHRNLMLRLIYEMLPQEVKLSRKSAQRLVKSETDESIYNSIQLSFTSNSSLPKREASRPL